MDEIWDRTSFEVIGRCGGDKQTELPPRTDKSRTLKTERKYHNYVASLNKQC